MFKHYGLPGWLGWGTYGAESSYGQAGEFKFGGIDLPAGNTSNLALAARESAKAYAGLVKQYGSVTAAVPHYSGNSYTVAHVKSLAAGGGQGHMVDASLLNHLGEILGGNFAGGLGSAAGEALGEGKSPLAPVEEAAGGLSSGLSSVGDFFSALTNVETWIRIGEVLAGAVLLYLGLKSLTGAELPSGIPIPV